MCRLVQNPSDVAPFVPLLLPAMDKNIDEIVDQEVCDVLKTAREVLLQAMGEGAATEDSQASTSPLTTAEVETGIVSILQSKFPGFADDHEQNIMKYIAQLCSNLIVYDSPMNPTLLEKDQSEVSGEKWKYGVAMSNHTEWRGCISSYVEPFLVVMSNIAEAKQNAADETADSTQDEEPKPISTEIFSHDLRVAALGTVPDMVTDDSVDEKDLVCNIEFSLAFGGKILLHNTKLKLGRGRRYALMVSCVLKINLYRYSNLIILRGKMVLVKPLCSLISAITTLKAFQLI